MDILQRNLGLDDLGKVKGFDSLRESQLDLTKIIVMELEELANKLELN